MHRLVAITSLLFCAPAFAHIDHDSSPLQHALHHLFETLTPAGIIVTGLVLCGLYALLRHLGAGRNKP